MKSKIRRGVKIIGVSFLIVILLFIILVSIAPKIRFSPIFLKAEIEDRLQAFAPEASFKSYSIDIAGNIYIDAIKFDGNEINHARVKLGLTRKFNVYVRRIYLIGARINYDTEDDGELNLKILHSLENLEISFVNSVLIINSREYKLNSGYFKTDFSQGKSIYGFKADLILGDELFNIAGDGVDFDKLKLTADFKELDAQNLNLFLKNFFKMENTIDLNGHITGRADIVKNLADIKFSAAGGAVLNKINFKDYENKNLIIEKFNFESLILPSAFEIKDFFLETSQGNFNIEGRFQEKERVLKVKYDKLNAGTSGLTDFLLKKVEGFYLSGIFSGNFIFEDTAGKKVLSGNTDLKNNNFAYKDIFIKPQSMAGTMKFKVDPDGFPSSLNLKFNDSVLTLDFYGNYIKVYDINVNTLDFFSITSAEYDFFSSEGITPAGKVKGEIFIDSGPVYYKGFFDFKDARLDISEEIYKEKGEKFTAEFQADKNGKRIDFKISLKDGFLNGNKTGNSVIITNLNLSSLNIRQIFHFVFLNEIDFKGRLSGNLSYFKNTVSGNLNLTPMEVEFFDFKIPAGIRKLCGFNYAFDGEKGTLNSLKFNFGRNQILGSGWKGGNESFYDYNFNVYASDFVEIWKSDYTENIQDASGVMRGILKIKSDSEKQEISSNVNLNEASYSVKDNHIKRFNETASLHMDITNKPSIIEVAGIEYKYEKSLLRVNGSLDKEAGYYVANLIMSADIWEKDLEKTVADYREKFIFDYNLSLTASQIKDKNDRIKLNWTVTGDFQNLKFNFRKREIIIKALENALSNLLTPFFKTLQKIIPVLR